VLLSTRRDLAATRRFILALRAGTIPAEVTTDRAPAYPRVLDELIPSALRTVERYANNPVEADHGRPKTRLRPRRSDPRLLVLAWIRTDVPAAETRSTARPAS
jgi:transposase-like protein